MNPTASAKPKAKFSSRNLSAVFKAPLRTKPLPDNATGPLQRPNNRMLVLGRASVAAPAPLNTPSLKRESQVHDVHVSLVPAGSNWAESAEKQQKPQESETPPTPSSVVTPTALPEKVWTPENVAEHLHTGSAPVRTKVAPESSGRWGDDAVEHDIAHNNIRRQMQKEIEFPDLKEAAEEAQMHYGEGHASAADRSPSIGPQQSGHQHGRATGRWSHFNEQEEMYRPMQDDRWSRDRDGRDEDDHWSKGRYDRDEDDRWSRDRYSRDDDDRWSRGRYSRHDDGYGREQGRNESTNKVISPVPNDSHTHFSRSDARFDMVASGDRDRVLSHSPHRMDWGSSRLIRRDGRSSSPSLPSGPDSSRFRSPQPDRSLTQSPVPASPSPSPKTSPITADAAPARLMNWRNLPSPEQGSARTTSHQSANAWSQDEDVSTPVAEATESSTESSSNSSASSSPTPLQQVQLLKRPKMLFDPKTGRMVNADDKAASGKRYAGGRNGGTDQKSAHVSTVSGATPAAKRCGRKTEAISKVASSKTTTSSAKTEETVAVVVVGDASTVNSMQKEAVSKDLMSASETPCSVSSNAVLAELTVDNADVLASTEESNGKRVPKRQATKQPAQQEVGSHVVKSSRGLRSITSRATQHAQQVRNSQSPAVNIERSRPKKIKTPERGKRNTPTRNDGRDAEKSKATQRRSNKKLEVTSAQRSKVDPSEVALLKQIAEGSSGRVVVLTDQQEGIEVNHEDEGFETVKSRRAMLTEKKQLRQRLTSTEAAALEPNEKKSARALVDEHVNKQGKGEQVQETFGITSKVVDTQAASRPRGKVTNSRRSVEQVPKDKKPRSKQLKQPARISGPNNKHMQAKATADSGNTFTAESTQSASPGKPTEQVAGEAPAESPIPKKRPQYVKVASVTETKREQKSRREKQAQVNSTRKSNERKASTPIAGGNSRKQKPVKRVVEKTKPRGLAAKAKVKQVRQVYVVKTPAPAADAASIATSTAA